MGLLKNNAKTDKMNIPRMLKIMIFILVFFIMLFTFLSLLNYNLENPGVKRGPDPALIFHFSLISTLVSIHFRETITFMLTAVNQRPRIQDRQCAVAGKSLSKQHKKRLQKNRRQFRL